MAEALEKLQKMEGACQRVLDLLTQAVQNIEEAVNLSDDLFKTHKPHPVIESSIKGVQGNIASVVNLHNDLVAKIRELQQDSQYLSDDDSS
jgi:hypothetical protein